MSAVKVQRPHPLDYRLITLTGGCGCKNGKTGDVITFGFFKMWRELSSDIEHNFVLKALNELDAAVGACRVKRFIPAA
jgi:hypothetical protein